jgi:phosphocarrier protein FPr
MELTTKLQIFAPLSGLVVDLSQVPDPVFAKKMVGDGMAVDPTDGVLVSPCQATVHYIHPSKHAVTLRTPHGVEILLHIGIDTVQSKGVGFTPLVKVGDSVAPGTRLIEFDLDQIGLNAKSLISPVIITAGGHDLQLTTIEKVRAGKDCLFELTIVAAATPTETDSGQAVVKMQFQLQTASGLHARPAALIVATAKKFASTLEIRHGERIANAKSTTGLLTLEAEYGDVLEVLARGSDAPAAVTAVIGVLKGLGEEHPPTKSAPAGLDNHGFTASVASPGLAVGKIFKLITSSAHIPEEAIGSAAVEKVKLTQALGDSRKELDDSQKRFDPQSAQAQIFAAHTQLLDDPDLLTVCDELLNAGKSAAFAWHQATTLMAERIAALKSELLAQRALDIKDVGARVLKHLTGASEAELEIPEESILLAENLTPSQTASLDAKRVVGFCTSGGGTTSHVAILAKSMGIPALVGIDPQLFKTPDGTPAVLDADRGELRLNPSADDIATVRKTQERLRHRRQEAASHAHELATTADAHRVEVAANIGGLEDAVKALEAGCEGVGLLRSEFLFFDRDVPPTEQEQLDVYQKIADLLGDRPFVIRTLDVGGDKPLKYLPLAAEENPFLGIRGLRVARTNTQLFREQVRAILRVKGRAIHMMFPMVAQLDELRWARAIVDEEQAHLKTPPVRLGIMIEVPSAALMADVFAPHVDFFSVGTNDLAQYTLAMDRGHQELARQVDGLDPSVLMLIQKTVKAAHRHGKWVGVCGGIASDPVAVPILIGLGVDELSVSIPGIPLIKSQIREWTLRDCESLAQRALTASSAKQVRALKIAGTSVQEVKDEKNI